MLNLNKFYRFAFEISEPDYIAVHEEFFAIPEDKSVEWVEDYCENRFYQWLERKFGNRADEHIGMWSHQEISQNIFDNHAGLYYSITG